MIYLACPYSTPMISSDTVRARGNFVTQVAAWLLGCGVDVFSPVTYSMSMADVTAEGPETGILCDFDWYQFDLRVLEKCDGILVVAMDGWERSMGVQLELDRASELGLTLSWLYYDKNAGSYVVGDEIGDEGVIPIWDAPALPYGREPLTKGRALTAVSGE